MPQQRFTDQVAFVTGAGGGIGRTTALAFAAEGARVVAVDRHADAAAGTARMVTAAGGDALAVTCDVTDEDQVRAALAATTAAFGRLDVAFNNAGVDQSRTTLEELTAEEWARLIAVDLTGVYHCIKHQVPLLRAAGGGAIVSTSSGAGVIGIAGQAGYAAAKWGVIGLTKSVALEVAGDGIRVNAVCPGVIDTPMMGRAFGEGRQGQDAAAAQSPLQRPGRPEEIASAVLWLCSADAAFTVGTALVVDGGQTVG